MYNIEFSKKAMKDRAYLRAAKLDDKAKELLTIIAENPFQTPPPYKSLAGKMAGILSRRINRQHRLVYEVINAKQKIYVYSMWSHYDF